jgi:hypothetical protein
MKMANNLSSYQKALVNGARRLRGQEPVSQYLRDCDEVVLGYTAMIGRYIRPREEKLSIGQFHRI